jgi:hypothetical protein
VDKVEKLEKRSRSNKGLESHCWMGWMDGWMDGWMRWVGEWMGGSYQNVRYAYLFRHFSEKYKVQIDRSSVSTSEGS